MAWRNRWRQTGEPQPHRPPPPPPPPPSPDLGTWIPTPPPPGRVDVWLVPHSVHSVLVLFILFYSSLMHSIIPTSPTPPSLGRTVGWLLPGWWTGLPPDPLDLALPPPHLPPAHTDLTPTGSVLGLVGGWVVELGGEPPLNRNLPQVGGAQVNSPLAPGWVVRPHPHPRNRTGIIV